MIVKKITALMGILGLFSATAFAAPYSERTVGSPELDFSRYGTVLKPIKTKSVDTGGTLIFSDSPEYVKEDGILYRDTVKGEARVLYYHLNDTTENKKIAVVLANRENRPVNITVKRGGDGTPNAIDYCALGKATQTAYFGRQPSRSFTLEPGEKCLLHHIMDDRVVKPQELVYGVYDFFAGGKIEVTVTACPASANPIGFIDKAKALPADEVRLRGTFTGMNRLITAKKPYNPAKDGPSFLTLSDENQDPYRRGIDAMDGSEAINQGNYGIVYWLDIPTVGKGKTRYMLVPLGGVYAGAMRAHVEGKTPQLIPTPQGRVWFGDQPLTDEQNEAQNAAFEVGQAILFPDVEQTELGEFDNGRRLLFEYSPPGASNLPVNFVLIPVNED